MANTVASLIQKVTELTGKTLTTVPKRAASGADAVTSTKTTKVMVTLR